MTKERAVAAWKVVAGPTTFFINSSALPRRAGAGGMTKGESGLEGRFFLLLGRCRIV
jgi:hypothetical protein